MYDGSNRFKLDIHMAYLVFHVDLKAVTSGNLCYRGMQAAYMQSPHFCDMCHVLLYSNYPKNRKAIEKLRLCYTMRFIVYPHEE